MNFVSPVLWGEYTSVSVMSGDAFSGASVLILTNPEPQEEKSSGLSGSQMLGCPVERMTVQSGRVCILVRPKIG